MIVRLTEVHQDLPELLAQKERWETPVDQAEDNLESRVVMGRPVFRVHQEDVDLQGWLSQFLPTKLAFQVLLVNQEA